MKQALGILAALGALLAGALLFTLFRSHIADGTIVLGLFAVVTCAAAGKAYTAVVADPAAKESEARRRERLEEIRQRKNQGV